MRRSGVLGILVLLIPLLLAAAEERIENGRELLAPDGRTLIAKDDGFSIVLPSTDWKVYLWRYEPYQGDAGFELTLTRPTGEWRLRIHEKIYPVPVSLEALQKVVAAHKDPREKVLSNKIVKVEGLKCLEMETESRTGDRLLHNLGWLCDRGGGRQFSVQVYPGVPADQWPAEEKVLRELVGSFRILR